MQSAGTDAEQLCSAFAVGSNTFQSPPDQLFFDIPERRRGTREKIRATLITLGFIRLQDSVWVYPYDCEDLILILKADFKIGKDVLYIIADQIEYDAPLRTYFNLPKRP